LPLRRLISLASLGLLRPTRMRDYRRLQRSQWHDPGRLRQMQLAKLQALLRHAARHVPFYRPLLSGRELADLASGPHILADLPPVDKHVLTQRQAEFLAEGYPDLLSGHTGGSTGTVFYFKTDPEVKTLRRATDLRGRTWAGWRLGERQALLWGHQGDLMGNEAPGGRLRNILVNRTLWLNAFDLGEQELRDYHAKLVAERPALLIGYASALGLMARYILDEGLPPPRVRGIISSAETLTDEHRQLVEKGFDAPLLDRYGSREVGPVAQQCERIGGLHVNAERFWLEILDPRGRPCAPGERGEIVLTDLDARGMPFIRYRTGDLAVPSDQRCPCGRGLPLLARVEGRVTDVLVGQNGRIIVCPGPTFFLAGMKTVTQLQIEQLTLASLRLRLVPGPGWGPESRRQLAARMQDLLGDVTVEFEEVASIPPTPSGKYRFAISRVSPFRTT